jgi:GTP cyclohydrolase I
MNTDKIAAGVSLILEGMGIDPTDHNFTDTPKRVAKWYTEIFRPPESNWTTFKEDHNNLIIMRGITFTTLCPHHLLPVKLTANVSYIPDGIVLGASKLVRLCHSVNIQPYTQEKLTDLIATRLNIVAKDNKGVAVVMYGEHDCMKIRGVREPNAVMITSTFYGKFEKDNHLQWQALQIPR